jgi:hypothetical protein
VRHCTASFSYALFTTGSWRHSSRGRASVIVQHNTPYRSYWTLRHSTTVRAAFDISRPKAKIKWVPYLRTVLSWQCSKNIYKIVLHKIWNKTAIFGPQLSSNLGVSRSHIHCDILKPVLHIARATLYHSFRSRIFVKSRFSAVLAHFSTLRPVGFAWHFTAAHVMNSGEYFMRLGMGVSFVSVWQTVQWWGNLYKCSWSFDKEFRENKILVSTYGSAKDDNGNGMNGKEWASVTEK